MNILKTKPVKMSLDAIMNDMTKEEMKGIMAGSGGGSYYGSNAYYMDQAYHYMLQDTSGSGLGGGGGGSVGGSLGAGLFGGYGGGLATAAAYNGLTGGSGSSSSQTWQINANGNYYTNDSADIARFFEMIKDPTAGHSITDISSFIKGEISIMAQLTQLTQTAQLTGSVGQTGINDVAAIKALQSKNYIQLKEVIVTKGYSKQVSGAFDSKWGTYDIYTNPYTNDTIQLFTGSGGGLGTGDGVNLFTNAVPPITSHGSVYKPTKLDAALMSKYVYGGADADYRLLIETDGWSVSHAADGLGLNFNPISGLKSQLFEKLLPNGAKEYCYVTAGTEVTDPRDYAANVLQLIGGSQQYSDSINNARALATLFGGALSFAGHSLGGALAEANAKITGGSALTFNAAGLSPITTAFSTNTNNTDAYVMTNDPLNQIQQFSVHLTGIPLPSAGGTVHYLDNGGSIIDLSAHSIDTVISAFGGNPY